MYPSGCESDEDCDYAYVCAPSQQCVPYDEGTPGPDRCHTTSDCDPGLVCDMYDRCIAQGEGGASGANDGEAGATTSGGQAGGGAAGSAN